MAQAITVQGTAPKAPAQPLACSLCCKEVNGRRGLVANMGEVALENRTDTFLEISYRMTALQHLNLVVTDSRGHVVSEGHFGDRFAPTLEPRVLRLEPGEKFKANVHLFATVRSDPIPPGTYTVRAIYEYNGSCAVSDPVQITV